MTIQELFDGITEIFDGNSGCTRIEGDKVVIPALSDGDYNWPRLEFWLAPDNASVVVATVYDSEGPRSSLFGSPFDAINWALEA
jgi:hypothetical protein